MTAPVRVLVVDDSAVVRQAIRKGLDARDGIEVVGVARDPYEARDQISSLKPDVITLDIQMPRMNGLSFLKRLMKYHPIPTIIVSSVAQRGCSVAIECLESGAFDIVSKPTETTHLSDVVDALAELVISAHGADVQPVPQPKVAAASNGSVPAPLASVRPSDARKIIAIGASTGGTEALTRVLQRFPKDAPGVVVTQHMPPGFTTSFAQRLDQICTVSVREAQRGMLIEPGTVTIADGNYHLKIASSGQGYAARVLDGPKVCRHKPSVEVMFESVAQTAGAHSLGIMLTGMGRDGAQGMLSMRNAGATTICQDEASCVVFGMPKEAIDLGAAQWVTPLDEIADQVMEWVAGRLAVSEAA